MDIRQLLAHSENLTALAAQIGRTESMVRLYARGLRCPPKRVAVRLAKATGTRLEMKGAEWNFVK